MLLQHALLSNIFLLLNEHKTQDMSIKGRKNGENEKEMYDLLLFMCFWMVHVSVGGGRMIVWFGKRMWISWSLIFVLAFCFLFTLFDFLD
jgi:hypothetical protein